MMEIIKSSNKEKNGIIKEKMVQFVWSKIVICQSEKGGYFKFRCMNNNYISLNAN